MIRETLKSLDKVVDVVAALTMWGAFTLGYANFETAAVFLLAMLLITVPTHSAVNDNE